MTRLLLLTALVALVTLGCARKSSNTRDAPPAKPAVTAKAKAAPANATRPVSHGMPGPLTPEPGFEHGASSVPKAPTVNVKSMGEMGELLEGNAYFFKLLSMKPCGEQPDPATALPAARRVVAAEIEVTAKGEFNVSPRDVAIGVGGITFRGSVDPKRKVPGCTPLLGISVLRDKDVAKGFVLFDIPVSGPGSDLHQMNLVYHPTRFGGAGQVMVHLPWS